VHYEAALKASPDHAGAKQGLAAIQNSSDYKLRALVAQYVKLERALVLDVAIEDNVGPDFFKEWEKKMQDLSNYVFDITEGQFFIAAVELEDSVSEGRLLVQKGTLNSGGLQGDSGVLAYCTSPGNPDWRVTCSGRGSVSTLTHEIFHGIFGLPDEYYQQPMCDCVMKSAPNPQKLCDETNHVDSTGGDADGKSS
jgi:hypothetical protein